METKQGMVDADIFEMSCKGRDESGSVNNGQ
jgi:hypothetical protein